MFFKKNKINWFLFWVIINLCVLLIFSECILGSKNCVSIDIFVPFSANSKLAYYDISEFLVYTFFPLLIWFILGKKKKLKNRIDTVTEPRLKPVSYSLVNPNGLILCTGSYALCIHFKKQHKFAIVKPNFK
jgi:hypothetical protein